MKKRLISLFLAAVLLLAFSGVFQVSASADDLLGQAVTTASSDADGIHVSWNSVEGADGYKVYRRAAGTSKWTAIKFVLDEFFLDNTADKGVVYQYVVRAYEVVNGSKVLGEIDTSKYSSGIWLATPELKNAESTDSGIKVTWSEVTGATSYRIYRKTDGGSYAYLDKTSDTSYTDTTAAKGSSYIYTVRAYAANARSGFDRAGIKGASLDNVKPSIFSDSDGITLTWTAQSSADGYKVYRRVKGTSKWNVLKFVTEASYKDTTAAKGTTYEYAVRAYITVNGTKVLGAFNTADAVSCIWLETPALSAAECADSGVKLTWKAVDGATSYRVYRKVPGGSYAYYKTVTGTSYTDTAAECGQLYTYTVRAYAANARSGFSKAGISGVYLKNSTITKVNTSSKGIELTYTAVDGADGYKVYRRKEGASSWSTLGFTSKTTYTDTTSIKDVKYEYVVRAYKTVNGKTVLGKWYSSDKASATGVGKVYVIVIDPGHDADHTGATALDGTNEKDLNLKIAKACKAELEKYDGVVVYMTRETDACPNPGSVNKQCLISRNAFAKSVGCDYIISIHNNASGGYGGEVFYPNTNYRPEFSTLGKAMASNILDELSDLGIYYRGLYTRTDDDGEYIYPDGSYADYYSIIRNAKLNGYTGLIVEHAFVDNSGDFYSFLSTDAQLAALGRADARGIAKTLGLTKK
ncbi:MAG: N-acetylmuramoyl-L-alanine amidase [Lachnospiraceae bacterium]|nr:N-acetylmuramoyl-L-alanine amidase [Lachnospiraceae bacterium]MBR6349531.1 N-acetylmuramoyl-L-alanine amidase [Lachnospiraceae bacterium]